jgi:hypothetical protein
LSAERIAETSDVIASDVIASDLKCTAWDPNDASADEGRKYTGRTPGDIARQHAEWMYRQGDPQDEYTVRVRAAKDGTAREWDVIVYAVLDVSFATSPACPVSMPVEIPECRDP